ncbi:MAG: TMEM165/GDT1 family protein [Ilumatobacteraceae bacterium]
MSVQGLLVAFGAVFLAELPDKTMVASLVMTTRYRRPLAVWLGVSSAFVLHVVLAVTIGSLLRNLPEAPVKVAVAALFLGGGVVLLRSHDGGDEADETGGRGTDATTFTKVALTAASVVGLAEFGDLTQLATASIATQYSAPVSVALGAWMALSAVAAIAVTAGSWIVQHIRLSLVQRTAGILFVAFGTYTAVSVVVSLVD